jgi:cell shape-determining protein MreD
MLANFISIPVMFILSVLQSTAISRITLIHGSADIVLLAVAAWGVRERGYNAFVWALIGGLFIALITAMPFYIPITAYMFVALLAKLLYGRIWQSPISMLIIIVFTGTIFEQVMSVFYLQVNGASAGLVESLRDFTLPSLLLNFFFLFPMYALMSDLRKWVMPGENYE